MKRLLLLRHFKSLPGEVGQRDRDRPLSQRGWRDARTMAAVLADHPPAPDLILCSSARRTRESLSAILPHIDGDTTVRIADAIYETDEATYIPLIAAHGGTANVVLLVGHNPTVHATAVTLAGSGPEHLRADLAAKYPTGALAILEFRGGSWDDLAPGTGTIAAAVSPRAAAAP